MAEVVKLEHVKKYYHTPQGETEALKDIHFSVGETEFVSMIGPSVCGKSTVLSLIAGLEDPSGGRVLLNGVDARTVRGKIGYMLQQDQLFPWLTIRQNVLLGPDIRHMRTKETEEKADALLEQYGLGTFKNAYPAHLSGGMRQRAALIRTLVPDPALLLLDEPFSALDYQTRLAVADDIRAIIK
ncbi:MAG: ATP-binding cassette domain-containing protein, partial [Clostridia bacterium]|nr:ATP-binding cassette domain-containing protein [Clostridia bacterium]